MNEKTPSYNRFTHYLRYLGSFQRVKIPPYNYIVTECETSKTKFSQAHLTRFNSIALRKAKIVYNFGISECKRVKTFYLVLLYTININNVQFLLSSKNLVLHPMMHFKKQQAYT